MRRQDAELEELRAKLALMRTGEQGGWWRDSDISLKVAKLLRVLRLRYVQPNSGLARLAQRVNDVVDAWLLIERRRLLSAEEGSAEQSPELSRLLDLSDPYATWKHRTEPALDGADDPSFADDGPLISIILPVYKVPVRILEATLRSLRSQTYRNWEACVAFADPDRGASLALLRRYARKDRRFRLAVLDENLGISGNSNAALRLARGDYIALLDHDDELPPRALSRMVAALRKAPQADFLYSDKEMLSERGDRRFSPLFKPCWSPEMMYSVNYLTHLNLIRADLMQAIGGWAMGVDGAQDWDLFLRATERASCIVRAPGVSYSWRVHSGSTSSGLDAKPYALEAQLRSLERHAERTGLPGVFQPNEETGFKVAWKAVAPVRVIVLGSSDTTPLFNLIETLQRDRADFTRVDVLQLPTDAWSFQSEWRKSRGPMPDWCHIHPVLGADPVATCLPLLEVAPEDVTTILDGALLVYTPGALRQLAGWLYPGSAIAFASGVTVESDDHVIEAGCVLDGAGVAHPLFRSEALRRWNLFGGPLWHRNVEVASPYMLAFRTAEVKEALAGITEGSWQHRFHDVCEALIRSRANGRGVVDPTARALIAPGLAFPQPAQGMIGPAGRYLHPYLTITPQRGMVLAQGVPHAA